MIRIRAAWASCWSCLSVLARRPFKGPVVEGWSWRLELLAEVFRSIGRVSAKYPAERVRKLIVGAPLLPQIARQLTITRTELGGVRVLSVTPKSWVPTRPTLLYFHGGGYVICSPESHRDAVARLALSSGSRVLSVDYRLAPEHPFPAAVEDAWAAYQALRASGVAAERIIVAGDSAGGGLSVALLLKLRDANEPQPGGALLISPWVDLTISTASVHANEEQCFLNADVLRTFADAYLAGESATHPLASPLYASLHDLAPMFILVGGGEAIHDEGVAFAARVREAGGQATCVVYPGLIHVWISFLAFIPDGREALDEVRAFIEGVRIAAAKPQSGLAGAR